MPAHLVSFLEPEKHCIPVLCHPVHVQLRGQQPDCVSHSTHHVRGQLHDAPAEDNAACVSSLLQTCTSGLHRS